MIIKKKKNKRRKERIWGKKYEESNREKFRKNRINEDEEELR